MQISRRNFLKASSLLSASAFIPIPAHCAPAGVNLRAGVFRQRIVAEGAETEVWGFNGAVPGPVLRFRRGQRVRVDYANALPEESTVHWHGLRVPNAMDGVPNVTQKAVAPGKSFVYEFDLADSGTFWYHPHFKSFEQVARGLYGAFIVEEDDAPAVDREVLWVLSDFKLAADQQHVADFGAGKDLGGVGRIGNVVTINGRSNAGATLQVRAGERIRLRLINAASARIFGPRLAGHAPQVIGFDGQAVTPHEATPFDLTLGPGMRMDLVLDCMGAPGSRHAITDAWNKNREIATIVYADEAPLRKAPPGTPIALARNALPEPDTAMTRPHHVVFQGGRSGQPVIGKVDGKPLSMPEIMARHGLHWTLNLTAAHEHALTHTPFLTVKKGEHVHITLVNETGFEHPIHLHGHTFKVLSYNGAAPKYPEWRDTVFVAPRQTADIAFVADNPGDWMFHCHILEHAAGGMMGTIRVT